MPDFLLPDLGEGLEEAEVVAWHVAPGDAVTVDQIVVEVETAKAAVEVPVPFAGTVATLHAEPGTTVRVGQPLITVAEAVAAGRFAEPGTTVPDRAPEPDAPSDDASGNVLIGYGTASTAPVRRRRGTARRASRRVDAAPVISPLVRKQARDAGVDLATVHGSGPSGVIRRCDVTDAIRSRRSAPDVAPVGEPDLRVGEGETRIPLRGLRRTVAEKLSRSRREIPEATVWVDVDTTDLLAARAAMNSRSGSAPVSLLALLGRFTVAALRRHPELNGRIDGDEIVIPDSVHLGFAAQTERGLVVPVVRDAHRLSTRELSAALADRTSAARAGTLAPADLTGGTITVNNYGVFGVDGSAAIINFPEVAIVGLGRIIDRPWVVDGEITVRKISQLTLAFDHRVCDGGTAGGFLRAIADALENPVTALADL